MIEVVGVLNKAIYKWHGFDDMVKIDPPLRFEGDDVPSDEAIRAAIDGRGYPGLPDSFEAVYFRKADGCPSAS